MNARRSAPPQTAPRVTVYFPTYNQEMFVRSALNSVLQQDYEPLTIHISDDCSTDATFAIIEEVLADYHGPHQIQLHRNRENQFLDHTPNALKRLEPGIAIMAHGDDLQEPSRVSRLVEEFHRTGALVVASNAEIIDSDGHSLGLRHAVGQNHDLSISAFLKNRCSPVGFGAAIAWHSEIWDIFGPKRKGTRPIDDVLSFRGTLLGKVAYIDTPLIKWRVHDNNTTLAIMLKNARTPEERMLIEERTLQKQMASWTSNTLDAIQLSKSRPENPHLAAVIAESQAILLDLNRRYMAFRKNMLDVGLGVS